jgi:heat shock protein HslJ
MKKLLAVLLFFGIAECWKSQELQGVKWQIQRFEDLSAKTNTSVVLTYEAYIIFDSDSTYQGLICNEFRGFYKANPDHSIKLSKLGGTKMFCTGELGELEPKIWNLLRFADHYTFKGKNLVLHLPDKSAVYFVRE